MLSMDELNFVPSQTTMERPSAGTNVSATANLASPVVGQQQGSVQER